MQKKIDKPYKLPEMPSKEDLIKCRETSIVMMEELSKQKWEKDEYRTTMILALEGMGIAAELFAKLLDYKIGRKFDTFAWLDRFAMDWERTCKKSEIGEIIKNFTIAENL